jgi:hypothetical protein
MLNLVLRSLRSNRNFLKQDAMCNRGKTYPKNVCSRVEKNVNELWDKVNRDDRFPEQFVG